VRRSPMTCRKFVGLIRLLRDGELSDTDRRSFSQHVVQCRRCSEYLKGYELTVSALRRIAQDSSHSGETVIPNSLVLRILNNGPKRPKAS
jgi:anti-sigma factor RsiW